MKNKELNYKIIACYNPKEDKTWHFIIFKEKKEKFLAPNIMIDFGVKFLKACPKYEMPDYEDVIIDDKCHKIYLVLTSKGNPYGLKKNNKNVKIN